MNESELLAKIQNVAGSDNRKLLARFWLQMDARPTFLPLTFDDLRNLSADGRCVFHAILGGYTRKQLLPLNATLLGQLGHLIAKPHYRDVMVPLANQRAFHYYSAVQPDQVSRPVAQEADKGITQRDSSQHHDGD